MPHSTGTSAAADRDAVWQLGIRIKDDPIAHVALDGTFDTANTEYFDAFTRCGVPTRDGWLLIDAEKLDMLTSSGAGALIRCASKQAEAGGGLVMVIPPGNVRDVIGFMRLDMVIDTFDTIEQAIDFIEQQAGKENA